MQQLVDQAPTRPGYLSNFKRYCYGVDSPCVIVNVATVDTPSISVRNLPIVQAKGPASVGPETAQANPETPWQPASPYLTRTERPSPPPEPPPPVA